MERYQKRQQKQGAPHGRVHYPFGFSLLTLLQRNGLLGPVCADSVAGLRFTSGGLRAPGRFVACPAPVILYRARHKAPGNGLIGIFLAFASVPTPPASAVMRWALRTVLAERLPRYMVPAEWW
jgi:hypothetical protein